jgi:hypothetical protein
MYIPFLEAILAFLFGSGECDNRTLPLPPTYWYAVSPSNNDDPSLRQTRIPATTVDLTMDLPVESSRDLLSPASQSTTFYAVADLPYSQAEAVKLLRQMKTLPSDAEFVIHLGDLRLARNNRKCVRSEYDEAATQLRASRAPVFVIVGDNDWTDCPNQQEGWELWNETFVGFESMHWDHPFQIRRQSGRPENFSFVHKGSLFIGLNIVGGVPTTTDQKEWEERLQQQLVWVKSLVRDYQAPGVVGRIVLFGHADPNDYHNRYFFHGLKRFVQDELRNTIPITYVNGDKHVWSYNENWYQQPSLLRVMLSGNGKHPATKVTVTANGQYQAPSQAFEFDRRLQSEE